MLLRASLLLSEDLFYFFHVKELIKLLSGQHVLVERVWVSPSLSSLTHVSFAVISRGFDDLADDGARLFVYLAQSRVCDLVQGRSWVHIACWKHQILVLGGRR